MHRKTFSFRIQRTRKVPLINSSQDLPFSHQRKMLQRWRETINVLLRVVDTACRVKVRWCTNVVALVTISILILGKKQMTISLSLSPELVVDVVTLAKRMPPWFLKRICITRCSVAFKQYLSIIKANWTNTQCHSTISVKTPVTLLPPVMDPTSCLRSATHPLMYTKPLKTKVHSILWSQRPCFWSIQWTSIRVCSSNILLILSIKTWSPSKVAPISTVEAHSTTKCNEPPNWTIRIG